MVASIAASTAATNAASSFPAWGGPAIAGAATVGSAFLNNSGGSYRARNRDLRKQYKYQERYLPRIASAQFQQRVKDAKDAGLHPLAALGIARSSGGPASSPIIPGQNQTGSAISEGLRTGLQIHGQNQARKHAGQIAELQLDEQRLRNEWLATQIANDRIKAGAAAANAQRPTQRDPVQTQPAGNEADPITLVHPDGTKYPVFGGTPAEQLQKFIGEWADWMPQTLGRAWETFKEQTRHGTGTKDWPDRYKKFGESYHNRLQKQRKIDKRKARRSAYGNQPDYYGVP